MRIFGWCNDGFHEGAELAHATPCPGRSVRGQLCECVCHNHDEADLAAAEESRRATTPARTPARSTATRARQVHAEGSRLYYTTELAGEGWQVVDPFGKPAKISGATSWPSEEEAEHAAWNGNRRKVAREWVPTEDLDQSN